LPWTGHPGLETYRTMTGTVLLEGHGLPGRAWDTGLTAVDAWAVAELTK